MQQEGISNMAEEVKKVNPTEPENKKKENPYLKYPLILGIVCLICGGALGLVNYLTEPKIEQNEITKANAALFDIMNKNNIKYVSGSESESDILPEEVPWKEGEEHKYLDVRRKITGEDGAVYYYYQATTDKGYSGSVTFGGIVETVNYTIIGTEYIKGDEDNIGVTATRNMNYSVSNPFKSGDTVQSSSTAKMTLPQVQKALNAMISDAQSLK